MSTPRETIFTALRGEVPPERVPNVAGLPILRDGKPEVTLPPRNVRNGVRH